MAHTLKYSFLWAKDVVNAFVESYARGTYNLARLLDIPPGELRNSMTICLAGGNSLKWRILKRVVMALSQYNQDDLSRLLPNDRKALYECYVVMCTNDQLDGISAGEVLDNLRQRDLF